MKTELIINKTAGGGKAGKLLPEIISTFNKLNIPFHTSFTNSPGGATGLARQAANSGVELIISVGGDGTINEIINGILTANHQPALGIIPAGWANDFIKSIPIPNDIYQACQIIKEGKAKEIDLGLINQQTYFANICGIGLDAEITALSNQIKNNHPNWKTFSSYVYVLAAIRKLLLPLPSFKAKITIDDNIIEGEFLLLAIANGTIEGGKFNIAPDAEIDDGFLDIYTIQKMGRIRCFKFLPTIIKGTHRHVQGVSFFRSKEIIVETERPVLAQVAGEILIPQKKYHIQILPGKLSLICPS